MNDQISYTTINHVARKKLGLSILEYCLIEVIHKFQFKTGWCNISKRNLAESIGISRRQAFRSINRLIEIGLLVRDPGTAYIRTTEKWYMEAVA